MIKCKSNFIELVAITVIFLVLIFAPLPERKETPTPTPTATTKKVIKKATPKPTTRKPTHTVSRHSDSYFEYKTVTAYCSCAECCGNTDGITASGKKVKVGMVAASYPFGTKLKIRGKIYTVEDRLSERYSDRVDIFMNTHKEASDFGIQTIKVEILGR